jgi:hypothetical protein
MCYRRLLGPSFPVLSRLLVGVALLGSVQARAAAVLVDIKTVSTVGTGVSSSPLAEQLFLGSGQVAPMGSPLWFVADLNRDGLRVESLGRGTLQPSELLGADDVLLYRDVVDGDQPGSRAGAFRRVAASIDIPAGKTAEQVLGGHIYAILWDTPTVGDTALPGAGFGLLNLGLNAKPEFGNPFWAIDQPISTGMFSVDRDPTGSIPEPATTCGVAALLVAVAACQQQHRLRRRRSCP